MPSPRLSAIIACLLVHDVQTLTLHRIRSSASACARRQWIAKTLNVAGSISIVAGRNGSVKSARAAAAPMSTAMPESAKAYYPRLRDGYAELVALQKDFAEKGTAIGNWDIDNEIRRRLGTVGTVSPLFGLEKVLKKMRESMEDAEEAGIDVGVDTVEFAELGTDLVAGLVETDFLAYSAIFSDPSGNVGRKDESSDDYLRKTKVALDKTALLLLGLLRLLSLEGSAGGLAVTSEESSRDELNATGGGRH